MKLLVCGGRDYDDQMRVDYELDILGPHLVIEGGARGADRLARRWAERREVQCRTFAADWAKHGKSAGPIRNLLMLDEGKPDAVLAFPGGRGTADMVRQAERAGIPVTIVADLRPEPS